MINLDPGKNYNKKSKQSKKKNKIVCIVKLKAINYYKKLVYYLSFYTKLLTFNFQVYVLYILVSTNLSNSWNLYIFTLTELYSYLIAGYS